MIERIKTFSAKIWQNQAWRVLVFAVLTVLVFGSTALGWYSYKKKQIENKIASQPEPSQSSEITSPTPDASPSDQPTTNASPTGTPAATSQPTSSGSSSSSSSNSTQQTQIGTINDVATQIVRKSSGYCEALAPESWAMTSNQEASGADLWSPDQKMHAGWGITFVYSYMYPAEADFLNTWMPLAGYSGFSMTSSSDMGYGFTKRDFTASGKKGFIFYKKYDAADLGGYIMSVYIAGADSSVWDSQGATPSYSAISIRCVTQLRPGTSGSDPSSSSSNSEVSMSDKWTEAIMGYENVYSPSTGDHYEAPLNSYSETGPDGAGYYRSVPNGYEKLERGFGSY